MPWPPGKSLPNLRRRLDEELPVDANFLFFLLFCMFFRVQCALVQSMRFRYLEGSPADLVLSRLDYGGYVAIALIFVTKLFDLFRLNWWPRTLGGSVSYVSFWSLALIVGYLLHKFRLDGLRPTQQRGDFDWQRKTTWVLLAFGTMALPALACFAKLRADRRNSYRRSLTPAQKT